MAAALQGQNLPGAGLVIYRINETVVNSGLTNNQVNADENNKGVDVEEADGQKDLDNATNRADGGDVFPGSSNKRSFDNASNPASTGTISVCDISDSGPSMTANLFVSSGRCGAETNDCSGLSGLSSGNRSSAGVLLLLPLVAPLYWMIVDRKRAASGI